MNIKYTTLIPGATVGLYEKKSVVDFLYNHLDEYGDAKKDIEKAIDYALASGLQPGGLVLIAQDETDDVIGAVVINKTGMSGYIPENILVYIAVHSKARGQGVGKELMARTIEQTDGNIALHVEENNPARFLYEKMGFTNPYLEMRLDKSKMKG